MRIEKLIRILEIVAGGALDTVELARCLAGLDFQIYAVELEPRNIEQFRWNVGADDRETVVPSAQGESDGFADFHVTSPPHSSR